MVFTANRVKWFRARAARDRAREEVEILEEEFRRAHRSFERMAQVWRKLAEHAKDQQGKAAYGHKQSTMYYKLAFNCKKAMPVSLIIG